MCRVTCVVSCVPCAVGVQLYLNKLMRTLNLSKWSMVYYNNIIAIPLLVPCFFFFKELDTILSAYASFYAAPPSTILSRYCLLCD